VDDRHGGYLAHLEPFLRIHHSLPDMTESPHPQPSRHPRDWRAVIASRLALAVGLSVALCWAFAALADEIPEDAWMVRGDRSITVWLQAHSTEWGEAVFSAVSLFGSVILFALATAAVVVYLARRDRLRALTVATAGVGVILLNNGLKTIFHRGRPEYALEFVRRETWSFPSGHAMDSLVVYGVLACLLLETSRAARWRRTIIGAVAVLVLLVGYSRVYLGVHYTSDVIAGWLAGGVVLIVVITSYNAAARRVGSRHPAG
jgi:membrane-associated phospholipid phosphatase